MRTSWGLSVVVTAVLASAGPTDAVAQNPAMRTLSGGLVAKIVSASRSCDGGSMALAVEISNPSKVPVDIIYVEQMSALDNAGTAYRIRDYSGTARCKHGYVDDCLGLSGKGLRVPLEQFTRLDPGASAVLAFGLWHSSPGKGTLVTFSALYGYRVIDPTSEDRKTDAEKIRTIKTQSVGFSAHPLSVMGCR